MSYYSEAELSDMCFTFVGHNVKISRKASLYQTELMEIGDNSRIDDFCVVSGKVKIGRNVHITPMCLVAGGEPGVVIDDFSTLAYGVKVFSQSDDYSGETMVNSTIPKKYKNEKKEKVFIDKYSVIGANSVIMPGVTISEGTSVGAHSLVLKKTAPWTIVAGSPAKKISDRSKKLLELKDIFVRELL